MNYNSQISLGHNNKQGTDGLGYMESRVGFGVSTVFDGAQSRNSFLINGNAGSDLGPGHYDLPKTFGSQTTYKQLSYKPRKIQV